MTQSRSILEECLQARHALAVLLSQPHEDAAALAVFAHRPEILRGMTRHWLDLKQALASSSRGIPVVPMRGHIFVEACISADALALDRLLLHVGVDPEQSWDMPGYPHPWSAWTWLASTLLDDGTIDNEIAAESWEVLLPHLIAAGYDLDRHCDVPRSVQSTRREWLSGLNAERFERALLAAEWLSLNRTTLPSPFNNASRRL